MSACELRPAARDDRYGSAAVRERGLGRLGQHHDLARELEIGGGLSGADQAHELGELGDERLGGRRSAGERMSPLRYESWYSPNVSGSW